MKTVIKRINDPTYDAKVVCQRCERLPWEIQSYLGWLASSLLDIILPSHFPSLFSFVSRIFKVAFAIAYAKWKNYSMVETFEETAKNNPDKKMIIFVDENGHKDISFSEVISSQI